MSSWNVFTSLSEILGYLNDPLIKSHVEVQDLLLKYEQVKQHYSTSLSKRKYLFIVFEGLDGSGKTTMTRMAAKQINGMQVATPPKAIQHLRSYFDQCEPKLRRAYYSLGNYITALEIEDILSRQHVIMDRFWHSTASYALADSTKEIPPKGDSIYKWPSDLLKPDIVVFLNVQERNRVARIAWRQATSEEDKLKSNNIFRDRLYEVYGNMEGLTAVQCNLPPKKVFKAIMNDVLSPKLEHIPNS